MSSEDSGLWRLGAEAAREGYGFFIGNALSTAVLAVGSIVIARLLGSEGYGLYSLSFVFPSLLVLFTSLGIDQSLIKYISEYASKKMYSKIRRIFEISLLFKLVLGAAATIIIYFSSDVLSSMVLNRPYMSYLLKLSSTLILFQTIYTLCSSLFIGLGKASIAGALATLQAVVKVSLIISLLAFGLGLWGAVFGHVFGYLIATVIGLIIGSFLTRIRAVNPLDESSSLRLTLIKPLIVYGLPLYASTIFSVAVSQYNNVVLAKFASNIEIGSYMAAVNLSTIVLLVATPIATVLYPSFSKIEAMNRDNLPRVFELATRYSILLVAPTAIFVSAFSWELVGIVYGEDFQLAAPYLSLYAAFYSVYPFLSVEVSYFNGVGLPKKTLLVNTLIFILVLPLSPFFANFLKVTGVIMAVVIANLAAIIYATYFIVKKRGFALRGGRLVKIYLGSIVSAFSSAMLVKVIGLDMIFSLLIGGAAFLALYITFIGAFRALDERDYANLRGMLGGLRIIGEAASIAIDYMEFLDKRLRHLRS